MLPLGTHYHADHIGCLDDLVDAGVTVGTCYDRGNGPLDFPEGRFANQLQTKSPDFQFHHRLPCLFLHVRRDVEYVSSPGFAHLRLHDAATERRWRKERR